MTEPTAQQKNNMLWHPRTLAAILAVTLAFWLMWNWSTNPDKLVRAGFEHIRSQNYEALDEIVSQLRQDPRYTYHADFFAAVNLVDSEKYQEALALLDNAMAHPDLEVESRVLAGQAAYTLGAAGNAKLLWEEALALDPNSVPAHRWLGAMYYDLGAMDNAILHLQVVSRLVPDDPRPDRLMGLINLDYERPEVAIPHLQETLARSPDQAGAGKVWLELAECQVKQREFQAAIESLKQAEEGATKHRLIAECKLNLGELESAKTEIEMARREAPEDVESLLLSAQIFLLEGSLPNAIEALQEAARVDPFNHSAQMQLSQVLARNGDADAAEVHSARAEELQGMWQKFSDLQIDAINEMTNAQIRVEIARLAKELGKRELAATWYRAAIAIDPSRSDAREELADLEKQRDVPSLGG